MRKRARLFRKATVKRKKKQQQMTSWQLPGHLLREADVTFEGFQVILKCNKCGEMWPVILKESLSWTEGALICPKGCNVSHRESIQVDNQAENNLH